MSEGLLKKRIAESFAEINKVNIESALAFYVETQALIVVGEAKKEFPIKTTGKGTYSDPIPTFEELTKLHVKTLLEVYVWFNHWFGDSP